jgi:hypothetical protein
MSNHNYSCHGYTVKASELAPLLPEEHQSLYSTLVSNGDWEEAQKMLDDHLPSKGLPQPYLFLMEEEYESEDLEIGEMYASWDNNDLFEMVPRPELKALNRKNINPTLSRWVTWG